MKKLTFIAILLTTLLTTSCFVDGIDDDEIDLAASLNNTSWISTSSNNWDEDFEYLILVFISSSQVEIYSKMLDDSAETKDDTGSYTISGSSITLNFGSLSLSGTFSVDSMTLSGDGDTYNYSKQ